MSAADVARVAQLQRYAADLDAWAVWAVGDDVRRMREAADVARREASRLAVCGVGVGDLQIV